MPKTPYVIMRMHEGIGGLNSMAADMTKEAEEKRRAKGKRENGDEWEGQIHCASAVQDNQNDKVVNGQD